jgi:hypothetical protein
MRGTGSAFFVIVLATAGCMNPPTLPDEAATKGAPVSHAQETLPAPVMPDQVTESNAYEKAEALEIELSQAEMPENHAPTPLARPSRASDVRTGPETIRPN